MQLLCFLLAIFLNCVVVPVMCHSFLLDLERIPEEFTIFQPTSLIRNPVLPIMRLLILSVGSLCILSAPIPPLASFGGLVGGPSALYGLEKVASINLGEIAAIGEGALTAEQPLKSILKVKIQKSLTMAESTRNPLREGATADELNEFVRSKGPLNDFQNSKTIADRFGLQWKGSQKQVASFTAINEEYVKLLPLTDKVPVAGRTVQFVELNPIRLFDEEGGRIIIPDGFDDMKGPALPLEQRLLLEETHLKFDPDAPL